MKKIILIVVAAFVLAPVANAQTTCDESSYNFTFKLYLGTVNDDVQKISAAIDVDGDMGFYGSMLASDAADAYVQLAAEHPCTAYSQHKRVIWMNSLRFLRKAGVAFSNENYAAADTALGKAQAALRR